MNKFLLLIFIGVVAWWLIKRVRGKDAAGDAAGPKTEQMVTCGHCGLYLPQDEAVVQGDKYFCCAEHQRLSA